MIRVFVIMATLLAGLLNIQAADGNPDPKRELRGVWLATVWGIDWPQKQGTTAAIRKQQQKQLTEILDKAADMNLNVVCFQARPMADALYESTLEPWSSFVSGKRGSDPGWNPLLWVTEECHRRGMECYAWINPFRWSSGTRYSTPRDLEWRKKGWIITQGKNSIFNPALEEVRQHIVGVCREIVTTCPVDGIIFDDYFYPQGMSRKEDAPDYKNYRESGTAMNISDWRRANIHKTIADVHAMLSDVRPDVRFGISPAGVAGTDATSATVYGIEAPEVKASDWQWNDIYSDPLGWLYQHTVDFVSPQLYWPVDHPTAPFEPLSKWWSAAAARHGVHFYSSHTLADYKGKPLPAQEFSRQVELTRKASADNAAGFIFYSAKFLNRLDPDLFETPALTPATPWKAVTALHAPEKVMRDGENLTWPAVEAPVVSISSDASSRAIVRYAVYAVPTKTKERDAADRSSDGIASEYLLGVSYGNCFALPYNCLKGYRFAVTTLDGYGIESEPVWTK